MHGKMVQGRPPQPSNPPSRSDWDNWRGEIMTCRQNSGTLEITKNRMISRGFVASVQSYKTHLARWGSRRNATNDDVKYIAMVIRDHQLDDWNPADRPLFYVYGRWFRWSDAKRREKAADPPIDLSGPTVPKPHHIDIVWPRRRVSNRADSFSGPFAKTSQKDVVLLSTSGSSASYHERRPYSFDLGEEVMRFYPGGLYRTANQANVLPRAVSLPDDSLTVQNLFLSISNYINGAFGNEQFIENDVEELVSRFAEKGTKNLSDFHTYCITAVELWDRGLGKQAITWFGKASALVGDLLDERDPRLLEVFADVSLLLHAKGLDILYKMLLQQMCKMVQTKAEIGKTEMQPWALMFSHLSKLSGRDLIKTIKDGWRLGYDQFVRSPLGPAHPVNVVCKLNFLVRTQEHQSDLAWNQITHGKTDSNIGLQQRFAHGKLQYLQGKLYDALESMQAVLETCERAICMGDWKWRRLEIDAIELSARCSHDIEIQFPGYEGLAAAKNKLKTAITYSQKTHGRFEAKTLSMMLTLWTWLQEEGGNAEEAENLKKDIDYAIAMDTEV